MSSPGQPGPGSDSEAFKWPPAPTVAGPPTADADSNRALLDEVVRRIHGQGGRWRAGATCDGGPLHQGCPCPVGGDGGGGGGKERLPRKEVAWSQKTTALPALEELDDDAEMRDWATREALIYRLQAEAVPWDKTEEEEAAILRECIERRDGSAPPFEEGPGLCWLAAQPRIAPKKDDGGYGAGGGGGASRGGGRGGNGFRPLDAQPDLLPEGLKRKRTLTHRAAAAADAGRFSQAWAAAPSGTTAAVAKAPTLKDDGGADAAGADPCFDMDSAPRPTRRRLATAAVEAVEAAVALEPPPAVAGGVGSVGDLLLSTSDEASAWLSLLRARTAAENAIAPLHPPAVPAAGVSQEPLVAAAHPFLSNAAVFFNGGAEDPLGGAALPLPSLPGSESLSQASHQQSHQQSHQLFSAQPATPCYASDPAALLSHQLSHPLWQEAPPATTTSAVVEEEEAQSRAFWLHLQQTNPDVAKWLLFRALANVAAQADGSDAGGGVGAAGNSCGGVLGAVLGGGGGDTDLPLSPALIGQHAQHQQNAPQHQQAAPASCQQAYQQCEYLHCGLQYNLQPHPACDSPLHIPQLGFPQLGFPQLGFPQLGFPQLGFPQPGPPAQLQQYAAVPCSDAARQLVPPAAAPFLRAAAGWVSPAGAPTAVLDAAPQQSSIQQLLLALQPGGMGHEWSTAPPRWW